MSNTTIEIQQTTKLPAGYKQTAVGIIPKDWEVKKLGEIAKIKHGRDQKSIEVKDGIYPILGTGGEIGRTNSFLYDKPSVLIGRKGTIDKPKYMDTPFWTVDTLFYTELSDTIVPKWLFNLFQTINWYHYNEASGVPSLSGSNISAIKLPIPPLPEQQKIAEILSTWDNAIDNCKKIIKKLKKRNKGLAQQLLTGKTRVKGFEDMKWTELKANKIFKSHTDKTHNGDLEILSATQERGVIPRSMNNIDIKFDENSLGTYKKVEIGDFVISLRSFQGGIEYSEYEGIVSPAYTILKEILPISKSFYKVYFKTETFINRLNTIIYGIRDGKQISFGDFSTLNLPYPSIEEQEAITLILNASNEELKQYEQKLANLQLQKKGLMQQLLTGKVRVKLNK